MSQKIQPQRLDSIDSIVCCLYDVAAGQTAAPDPPPLPGSRSPPLGLGADPTL